MTGQIGNLLHEQIAYCRARAPEYDEWFLRQRRYDRGPEANARWFEEVAVVRTALGRLEGRPTASSTSFLADGIAGIYFVATLPEFRRRGIGRSVTLAPLLTAETLGVRAAILQATAAGESVYRQLGFRTICKLGRYRLAN